MRKGGRYEVVVFCCGFWLVFDGKYICLEQKEEQPKKLNPRKKKKINSKPQKYKIDAHKY